MALALPIYTEKRLPVEMAAPLSLNPTCTRCKLHEHAKNVCLPAAGSAGGVLFVGDYPGKYEDASGEPFTGATGKYLKRTLKQYWQGPIAFDNAIRCRPGKKMPDNAAEKCRGYLKKTIADAKPKRIISMGAQAAHGIFGEAVPVLSARRGIGWVYNDGEMIPVFILMNPVNALRNTFLQDWFEKDLKWALTCELGRQWKPPHDAFLQLVEMEMDARDAVEECREAGGATYDVETVGRIADGYFKIISLALTPYGTDDAWVFDEKELEDPAIVKVLVDFFEDPTIPKSGHNVKYDHESVIEYFKCKIEGTDVCTRLLRKMLWSDVSGYLEDMSFLVGMGGHKSEAKIALSKAKASITKARKRSSKAVSFLPGVESEVMIEACKTELDTEAYAYGLINREVLHRYNALDTIATERLRRWQLPQLEKLPPIKRIWDKVVHNSIDAVVQVERWGMPVDRNAVKAYDAYLSQRIEKLQKTFAEYDVSPGSSPQLSRLLYKDFDLPVLQETDSGAPSTAKGVLERLLTLESNTRAGKRKLEEPKRFIKDLLEYRALDKLKGTYADGLLQHIRADGRVHPNLDVAGASSGRTSCSNPNLQNIPRGSNEHAKLARGCFIAPPGRRIVQLDYSQLEYRVAAMLSGDPVMIDMFQRGIDFHTGTAELIALDYFGVNPEDITKEMRSQSKTFNFGLLYGMTDGGLAGRMGCTKDKAAELRAAIMGEWKELAIFIRHCLKVTRQTGFAWTQWEGEAARRRPLWRIGYTTDQDPYKKQKITAANSSLNTPVQGTASDYCVASLIACVDWLLASDLDAKLVLAVHDSLMFDVAEDDVDEVVSEARGIMESWDAGAVPIKVDAEVGSSWGSLESYDKAA